MAKTLTPNQKRCSDCASLVLKDGKWCCDECFDQSVEEIDDCPEGITIEQVTEIDNQKIKVDTGARSDTKTERKPRERKVDSEKAIILDYLKKGLTLAIDSTTIETENEVKLHFPFNGSSYSVTLTKHRPPKN